MFTAQKYKVRPADKKELFDMYHKKMIKTKRGANTSIAEGTKQAKTLSGKRYTFVSSTVPTNMLTLPIYLLCVHQLVLYYVLCSYTWEEWYSMKN